MNNLNQGNMNESFMFLMKEKYYDLSLQEALENLVHDLVNYHNQN